MNSFARFISSYTALLALPILLGAGVSAAQNGTPAQSGIFSTAAEEAYSTYQVPGDGDLWPSCWASDDNLYAAFGDGSGFNGGGSRRDIAVNKISGMPPNLTGTTLPADVGTNWSSGSYNRKPTGMLCSNGNLYLAYQNLNTTSFNDAPAASVTVSYNQGASWTDTTAPMFGVPGNSNDPAAYKFTTVFFLDYGKNSVNAIDGYVYAYGLDKNWREQQTLYLARVPANSIQNRATWQFYTGISGNTPTWSADILQKVAVLSDNRLLYPAIFDSNAVCPTNQPVIGQGGVVYDAPLRRYIFSSWSCTTHEFYDAPQPWGPWSHILSNDFGPFHYVPHQNQGQYGITIPSKFISADGLSMYVQSNVCCGGDSYTFSLRKLWLGLYVPSAIPVNQTSTLNLALEPGTRATSKSTHYGRLCALNCSDQLVNGALNVGEDDYDGEPKTTDWWGYTWPLPYNLNRVIYDTGTQVYPDGGWYASNLRVQVRQNLQWIDVSGAVVSPAYPYSQAAGAQTSYTFNFPNTWGDGVRIIGTPGGSSHFTAITRLGIYFAGTNGGTNLLGDPGFELQNTGTVSAPWVTEGPDGHGIDRGLGNAHSGANNAWIRDASTNWDSITQTITVQPNANYTLTGWIRNNFTANVGYFGVRGSDGVTVLKETTFGSASSYMQSVVNFNSGSNTRITVYAGFHGTGADQFIQVDDVSLM